MLSLREPVTSCLKRFPSSLAFLKNSPGTHVGDRFGACFSVMGSPKPVCHEPRQPGIPAAQHLPLCQSNAPGLHLIPPGADLSLHPAPVARRRLHRLLPPSPQTQPHRIIQHPNRQIIMTVRRPDHNRRRLNPTHPHHQLANHPQPPPKKARSKKERRNQPLPLLPPLP